MSRGPRRPQPALLGRRALLAGVGAAGGVGLLGCGGGTAAQRPQLPPASERSVLGPGDVFSLEIVGEKDLPTEYQVAADGSVDLPYVHTLRVAGLEAPDVARLVRRHLMEQKVLTDPSVIVQVKEFHSRRVTLLGQVARPGSFPYTPGLTLVQAVSLAGGVTGLAADRVNLTRKLENGLTRTVAVTIDGIMEGKAPDIPLQAGDQIFVHERLF